MRVLLLIALVFLQGCITDQQALLYESRGSRDDGKAIEIRVTRCQSGRTTSTLEWSAESVENATGSQRNTVIDADLPTSNPSFYGRVAGFFYERVEERVTPDLSQAPELNAVRAVPTFSCIYVSRYPAEFDFRRETRLEMEIALRISSTGHGRLAVTRLDWEPGDRNYEQLKVLVFFERPAVSADIALERSFARAEFDFSLRDLANGAALANREHAELASSQWFDLPAPSFDETSVAFQQFPITASVYIYEK